MDWFKHYNNTDDSEFIQTIEKRHGLLRYAHWMKFLELACSKYKESTTIRLTKSEVAQKLRIKPSSVDLVITSFLEADENQTTIKQGCSNNQAKKDDFILIIDMPILSDLKDRDFNRARANRGQTALRERVKSKEIRGKKKSKEKEKEKEPCGLHEKLKDSFIESYFVDVKLKTQEAWLVTYPNPEWIKNQIMKSITWLINQGEVRKDMGRYVSNWLARAKDDFDRRVVTSSKVTGHKHSDYAKMMIDECPYDLEEGA